MKKVSRTRVEIAGTDGGKVSIEYDNHGEPFRDAVLLTFNDDTNDCSSWVGASISLDDACKLRDALDDIISSV